MAYSYTQVHEHLFAYFQKEQGIRIEIEDTSFTVCIGEEVMMVDGFAEWEAVEVAAVRRAFKTQDS